MLHYVCCSYLIHASQLGDHLVAITLVDKKSLSLARVTHLHCVLRHQSVEESIVFLSNSPCTVKHKYFGTGKVLCVQQDLQCVSHCTLKTESSNFLMTM